MKTFLSYISCIFLIFTSLFFIGCKNIISPEKKLRAKGVWWWDSNLDSNMYLSFAKEQNVNEIYYCDSSLDSDTKNFVLKAKSYGMKTYLLAGEYQWLYDDSNLIKLVEKYISYNKNNKDAILSGIHLDIEPHQAEDFDTNRINLITSLVTIAKKLKSTYPEIEFSYDIPFWFEEDLTINNVTKKEFEWIFDYADKVYIMSYRDSYDKILSVAQSEFDYAKSKNKLIFLSVETKNLGDGNNNVTFYEEGFSYLSSVISELDNTLPENVGISIHHIRTFRELKYK